MLDFYSLLPDGRLGMAVLAASAALFIVLAYIVGRDLWERYKGP